jgi:hypothetical protein
VISNPSTAASDTPQAARQAALNAVLRRLVATPPRPRSGAAAPIPAKPTPPSATPPAAVPRWLTAPVLRLRIPDSPLAAGTVAPPPPAPKSEPVPEAAASEVFEVPPLVEPIAAPQLEPAPDLAARIMSEIATIVAQAPEAIAPFVVDLSGLTTSDEPAAAPAVPQAASAAPRPAAAIAIPPRAASPPAAPQPAPALPQRTAAPLRAAVRRPRPRVDRPQRRLAPPPPPKRAAPRPAAAAAQPALSPQPAPAPAVKAPAGKRPALAPAATGVARTLRTVAVPETRPLTQNRRLYRRVRLTAELEIAGRPCRLVDLSIGGFAAAGTDKLDQGALVPVTLRMTIDGIDIGTQFSARMVYGNGARAAGRFVELTGAQTAFLRYIVTWRGEAIGAVGTTTLLDAITRWPERAFQPHPSTVKPPEPERPGFWSRLIGRIPLLGRRRRD